LPLNGAKKGIIMEPCRGCGLDEPLVTFNSYPSGARFPNCKMCARLYQRKWRAKKDIKSRPDYMPECTQMRHPDDMIMEGNVQKHMKKVHDEERKITEARLGFIPEAGLCDQIIKGM
jgi:hypothetical protein